MNREIKILSLAFFFISLGFNAVQQYVTSYFARIGMAEIGFHSLILIYLFFILSNPLSAYFVSKYGSRKCTAYGSLFYFLFIITLLTKLPVIIYFSSVLIGIAASFLWTGANCYLIKVSEKDSYGKNSGFFSSFQSLGSALGVIILGFLVGRFLFKLPFLAFSLFPIIGFFLLLTTKEVASDRQINRFSLIGKSITSVTALKLSSIYFATSFIYGLAIGIIPIQIKNTIGISYVGVLSALFYILPIFFSYFFGKLSDIEGRQKIITFSYILLAIGLVFLFYSNYVFALVIGIFFLALNSAIIKPILYALVGDVSTKENMEFITALFWMVQNAGVVSALVISSLVKTEGIFIGSILVVIISFMILLPLLKLNLEEIKLKLSQEI